MRNSAVWTASVTCFALVTFVGILMNREGPDPGSAPPPPLLESTPPQTERLPDREQKPRDSTTSVQARDDADPQSDSHRGINSDTSQRDKEFAPFESVKVSDVWSETVDDSVIGRPFPLSPSAVPDCAKDDKSVECEDQQRLTDFAQEPRDGTWARQAEDRLRSMVERNTGYSIRNLECRLVTCLLEVQSLQGPLLSRQNLRGDEWHEVHVKPVGSRFGLEGDALGRRVTVTAWILRANPVGLSQLHRRTASNPFMTSASMARSN